MNNEIQLIIRIGTLTGLILSCVIELFAEVEVVVTASRVAEDARSTPAYIRVIPEEVVQRGRDLLDALRTIPDINIVSTSPGKEYVSMGGFGENGFMRTLILVDGNPINRADMSSIDWMSIPLGQIDRIEVVKGPMSSQLGDQAVAGAINIITKKPQGLNTSIKLDYDAILHGNNQELFLSYGTSRFRFNAVMNHKDRRSTRNNSNSEAVSARISPGITFGNLDIDLTGHYALGRYSLPGGISKEEYDTNPDTAHNNDSANNALLGMDFTGKLKLDNVNLKTTAFWNNRDISNDTDSYSSWSNTMYDEAGGSFQASADLPLGDSAVLNTVGGMDVKWSQINVKIYEDSNRNQLKSDETPQRTDLGFWGRGQILHENRKGQAWTVDAGIRFSRMIMLMASEDRIHLPLVFDAGLAYIPGKTWNFSLRYGRVFRYPAMDEQASYNGYGTSSVNTDLNPEYGHSFTASAELRQGRFKFAFSPYFTAMTDEIAFDSKAQTHMNLDSTYHFGQVTSLNWNFHMFNAEIAYSYDRAIFVETEKKIPLVPTHTVFTRIAIKPGKKIELSTDARFSSGYYESQDTANNLDMIPGRIVWNADIQWTMSTGLLLNFRLANILNDRTPTHVYWSSWYPSEGRVFTIGAEWRY